MSSAVELIKVPPEPPTPRRIPFVGKVQGLGKVTIPKNVRDLLGLKDGDYVECVVVAKINASDESA